MKERLIAIYCTRCHGHGFGGADFFNDPSLAVIDAPNLTHGQGGVGAHFSDTDWVRAIRHGIDHMASRLAAPTPGVTVAYGQYLADTFGCRTCHGPQLVGGKDPDPAAVLPQPDPERQSGELGRTSFPDRDSHPEERVDGFRGAESDDGRDATGSLALSAITGSPPQLACGGLPIWSAQPASAAGLDADEGKL